MISLEDVSFKIVRAYDYMVVNKKVQISVFYSLGWDRTFEREREVKISIDKGESKKERERT